MKKVLKTEYDIPSDIDIKVGTILYNVHDDWFSNCRSVYQPLYIDSSKCFVDNNVK